MLTLYNPPLQKLEIETDFQQYHEFGYDAEFPLSQHVEIIAMQLGRFVSRSVTGETTWPDAEVGAVSFEFKDGDEKISTRFFRLYFAKASENSYPVTLIKPQQADRLRITASVRFYATIKSRLILKQELPNALGIALPAND